MKSGTYKKLLGTGFILISIAYPIHYLGNYYYAIISEDQLAEAIELNHDNYYLEVVSFHPEYIHPETTITKGDNSYRLIEHYSSQDKIDVLRYLLNNGCDGEGEGLNYVNHPDTAKLLIKHGADPHQTDDLNRNALDFAMFSSSPDKTELIKLYRDMGVKSIFERVKTKRLWVQNADIHWLFDSIREAIPKKEFDRGFFTIISQNTKWLRLGYEEEKEYSLKEIIDIACEKLKLKYRCEIYRSVWCIRFVPMSQPYDALDLIHQASTGKAINKAKVTLLPRTIICDTHPDVLQRFYRERAENLCKGLHTRIDHFDKDDFLMRIETDDVPIFNLYLRMCARFNCKVEFGDKPFPRKRH